MRLKVRFKFSPTGRLRFVVFMVGSWSKRPFFGGSIWRIFRSNLELTFFRKVWQNSYIFRSWTFTAGVLGVVSATSWSQFLGPCLYSRMHFWWQVQYLVHFTFCKCTKSWQGRWSVRYGILLVILLRSALESCFLVKFVSIRSIVFCVSPSVCVLWISRQAQYMRNFSCLLIWLGKWRFSGAIALLLGLNGYSWVLQCSCWSPIFRCRQSRYIKFRISWVAPPNGLDKSCVATTKHECRSSCIDYWKWISLFDCVLHPIGCSAQCARLFMCIDYQTWMSKKRCSTEWYFVVPIPSTL